MSRSGWMLWVLITLISPLVFVFQNCAPATFQSGGFSPISGPRPPNSGGFQLLDMVLETPMNTPVEWNMSYQGSRVGLELSFHTHGVVTSLTVTDQVNSAVVGGTSSIQDAQAWRLRFAPANFYRGTVQFTVFALDNVGNVKSSSRVTIHVGRQIKEFKPSLALRAGGCVMCHAQVFGNIITDFGYRQSYFFGGLLPAGLRWNDGAAYGDHDAFISYGQGQKSPGAWARLKAQTGSSLTGNMKVMVPRQARPIPLEASQETGASDLAGYLRHRFQNSVYNSTRQLANSIETKQEILIRTPSVNELLTAFVWDPQVDGSAGFRYVPTDSQSFNLQGLNMDLSLRLATHGSLLVCEGDLLIVGSLKLKDLNLRTRTGCRIYVTEDVYIHGPIHFDRNTPHNYDKANLQIVSARAILMGLGSLWRNGQHCENNDNDSGYWGYYKDQNIWTANMSPSEKQRYLQAIANSADFRLRYFWGIGAWYTRDFPNPIVINDQIYQRFMQVNPQALDAACEVTGRNVRYERLLLVAPYVHSRYAGGFKGSIVAEFLLMPLGLAQNESRFRFEWDPVFENVMVLPFLRDQDFLRVQ